MVLRGGRLKKELIGSLRAFTSSLEQDMRLAYYDIRQSMAHARMLNRAGLLSEKDTEDIISKLQEILANINNGNDFSGEGHDDIHMAIEQELGPIGKKLHAGRSRNDQVACDMRMYVRDSVSRIAAGLGNTVRVLELIIDKESAASVVVPAYTHMQRAQTVTLAVYLGSFIDCFSRDIDRFTELYSRVNMLPLGAAACAGTNVPVDRKFLAEELDFDGILGNPMDAVGARDYILEFANDISVLGINISRLCEDIILFSTKEYSFVELDDSIAETSSIMPQKKNPDCFELLRSASAKFTGISMALHMMMKGLPMTYNRDMQNDKLIFDAAEAMLEITELLPLILQNLTFNKGSLAAASREGFMDAADFAEYLVLKRGYDFRDAHFKTGELVSKSIKNGYSRISDIALEEIKKTVKEAEEDLFDFIDPEKAAVRRMEIFFKDRS